MSKIYTKGKVPTNSREYKLNDFTKDVGIPEPIRKVLFEPDEFGSGEPDEFIAGGFDFAYEGGLRKEEILRKSLDEADETIRNAKAQALEITAKAEADGFEKGRNSGFEEGLAEIRPLADTFTKLVQEIMEVRKTFYDNSEEEMINLVMSVARAVLGIELPENPKLVRTVIRKAVQNLQTMEEMKIRINPEDMAEAEEFMPELEKEIQSSEKISFRADPLITRGGCMVETNIGSIDARIETQLEAIRESFIQAMQEDRARKITESETDDDT